MNAVNAHAYRHKLMSAEDAATLVATGSTLSMGKSLRERPLGLIGLAAPQFRPELLAEAKRMQLV
jgi:acyl-CoA hydrolase